MTDERKSYFSFPKFDFSKAGFADLLRRVRIPGFDPERLLQAQRRNIEALSEFTRTTAGTMGALAQRQCEQLTAAMTELANTTEELSRSSNPAEMFARQGERVNRAYEQALTNLGELQKTVGDANTAAFDALSRRVQESIDELRDVAQGASKDKKP